MHPRLWASAIATGWLFTIAASIWRLWAITLIFAPITLVFTSSCFWLSRLPMGFQYGVSWIMYDLWLLGIPWTNSLLKRRLLLQ